MKKKIIFTVTNDLAYDQRMQRICSTLASKYEVELVGRKLNSSLLKPQSFQQTRLNCFFKKGKFFYLEINVRLFLYLLFSKVDIVCSIDLDTLVAGYLASKIKRKPVVYDAHEYYTEVIELVNRPLERNIWLRVERTLVPRIKYAYTVSAGLQKIFTHKYKIPFELIRNISLLKPKPNMVFTERYLIYAGAVNAGRGVAEIITAMQQIDLPLYVCGSGDILEEMKALSLKLGLENKVNFFGSVAPDQLDIMIANAYIGFLLLENKGLSYYYSLANKFFDYVHGEIPQITINFPEYVEMNKQYEVAQLVTLEVSEIVQAVNKLCNDKEYYQRLVENCKIAKHDYCWQAESARLLAFYEQVK